jgi:hypothetical protein
VQHLLKGHDIPTAQFGEDDNSATDIVRGGLKKMTVLHRNWSLWFGADDNSMAEFVSVVLGEDDDNGISQCTYLYLYIIS